VFSHITVGTTNIAQSIAFYDAFLAPLGITRFWTAADGRTAGWEREAGDSRFFVGSPFNGEAPTPGNGWMCAFTAPSREAVNLCYNAALSQGGRDEGQPGLRSHYAPDYYGAYVRDPDGNKLHIVHRGS
jgi:catechol 2,3-dioxygenase-like lactoylglutathione lyase family enzyme